MIFEMMLLQEINECDLMDLQRYMSKEEEE